MNTSDIANSINALMNTTRTPAPKIPGILMAIGGMQKPGLSTTVSVGNITKGLNEHDIPTEAAPDGTENKLIRIIIEIVSEIYRALREDANIQTSFMPGTMSILSTGANSGGPVISNGFNINFPEGVSNIQ